MSLQSIPGLILTFTASGAVAARRAVGFNGAQASVAAQKIMGVSPRAVASSELGDVVASGTTIVEAGGAFAKGASLVVDAQGRAVASTGALSIKAGETDVQSTAADGAAVLTGADLPEFVFADALEAASGAGALVEVLLRR